MANFGHKMDTICNRVNHFTRHVACSPGSVIFSSRVLTRASFALKPENPDRGDFLTRPMRRVQKCTSAGDSSRHLPSAGEVQLLLDVEPRSATAAGGVGFVRKRYPQFEPDWIVPHAIVEVEKCGRWRTLRTLRTLRTDTSIQSTHCLAS